jgi:hypothetical protein
MSMKLVGCRGCGNLVGANERACPFCGAAVATPRFGLAAGVVLAGLVLGGCANKADTLLEGETESDTDAFDPDHPSNPSAGPNMDPPNSEATYGVPGTDSDWFGTESDGETETTGDVHDTDSTAGPASDTDTDTDAPPSESDGDTDTDTGGPASDTDVASSSAG